MRGVRSRLLGGASLLVALAACQPSVPDRLSSGFNFETDSFSFVNFDDGEGPGRMTAPLAARLFGDATVCATGAGDTCVPTAGARLWIDDMNRTLAAGHSEGMAVLAQLMFLKQVSAADFGGRTAAELSRSGKLQAELAYWSATQKVTSALAHDQTFEAKDVMPFLAGALKPGSKEAWRLAVAMVDADGIRGGHALVPFGFFKGDRDGLYFLQVYDPNKPQAEQRLEIDTKANTWKYEGSSDPADPRPYSGDGANHNKLYFSPVSARLGVQPSPFAADTKTMMVSAQDLTAVRLEDEGGGSVGLQNGVVVEHGGVFRPGFAACDCQAPTQIVNAHLDSVQGSQRVVVDDVGKYNADGGTVTVTGPGVSATVTGVKADKDSPTTSRPAVVDVSKDGKQVSYSGTTGGSVTATVTQPDGGTTTVTVAIPAQNTGGKVTVDATDPNNVVVQVSGVPAGTGVSVSVTNGTGAGAQTSATSFSTTEPAGSTSYGADVRIDTSTNTVTTNTDMRLDRCQNRILDLGETDVDCGGKTCGYCEIGQKCLNTSDCEAPPWGGPCVGNVCRAPTCQDGIKNQRETDVDCGGTCSARCGLGKGCGNPSDCDNVHNTCTAGTCVLSPQQQFHTAKLDWVAEDVRAEIDGVTSTWTLLAGVATNYPRDFTAYRSYSFTPLPNEKLDCVIDNASWTVDGGASSNNSFPTLRCQLARDQLLVKTTSTGCDGTQFSGTGPAYTVTLDGVTLNRVLPVMRLDPKYQTTPRFIEGYFASSASMQFTGTGSFVALDGGAAYTETCRIAAGNPGTVTAGVLNATFTNKNDTSIAVVSCTCDRAGPDGGVAVDGGVADAGSGCSADSECGTGNCYCGDSSGACAGAGRCGPAPTVISATTAGTAASGTYTVPAGCTTLHVSAWGAAGGGGSSGTFPAIPVMGGAGGFVSGTLAVSGGDVLSAWIGSGGAVASEAVGGEGAGSLYGTAAPGGLGDGQFGGPTGGGGGGLTSVQVKRASAVIASFSVPGGAGAGSSILGKAAGESGSGTGTTNAGEDATAGSTCGGGGAGEKGGLAGVGSGNPGDPGAFGTLPTGLTSQAGSFQATVNTASIDYKKCPADTGTGRSIAGGNGCVVLRCAAP